MSGALHFIGFKDERVQVARKVWGQPDFYHRHWDTRARQEIMPGDVAIFATGEFTDVPCEFAWNDSDQDILAYGGPEFL